MGGNMQSKTLELIEQMKKEADCFGKGDNMQSKTLELIEQLKKEAERLLQTTRELHDIVKQWS